MKLKDLLKGLKNYDLQGSSSIEITGISTHSKKTKPGDLFVALPGYSDDGKKYIEEAFQKGAQALLFEGSVFDKLRITQIRVSGAREVLAKVSANFYLHPSKHFYLTGITGTNGKTTLTYLLETLWQEAGLLTGLVGTVAIRYGSNSLTSHQTTPESRDLQELFSLMKEEGVGHVCMEVSSHAITQARVDELHFNSCVFTNLTQDHLDYHQTMEEYYLAKEKLFTHYLELSQKKDKLALIGSTDTEYGKRLVKQLGNIKVMTYGLDSSCHYYPKKYELGLDGLKATIQTPLGELKIRSKLFGQYNLLNILGAVAIAEHSGLSKIKIEKGIEACSQVPGRLERIEDPQGRIILVDYAHSPDALKNVLETLKSLTPPKIITVFGCGGDRDPKKRPLMGYEVGKNSDICVVTSDNPRSEDPHQIIKAILPGLKKANCSPYQNGRGYLIEPDRRLAIQKAIELSKKNDIVLIAGKGHEDYQILGTKKIHFSDQEVVRELLNASNC